MSDTGMKRKWLLPAVGAVLVAICLTGLTACILETTGILWVAILLTFAGSALTSFLAIMTDRAICEDSP